MEKRLLQKGSAGILPAVPCILQGNSSPGRAMRPRSADSFRRIIYRKVAKVAKERRGKALNLKFEIRKEEVEPRMDAGEKESQVLKSKAESRREEKEEAASSS